MFGNKSTVIGIALKWGNVGQVFTSKVYSNLTARFSGIGSECNLDNI